MTKLVCGVYLAGYCILYRYFVLFIIYDHIYAYSLVICTYRYAISVPLIKYDVVFSDGIVYTFLVSSFETVFRDRNQVFSFEGEYFIRSLICGPVLVMVSCTPEPGDTVFVEALNVCKSAVLRKTMLGKLDHIFYRSLRFRIGPST